MNPLFNMFGNQQGPFNNNCESVSVRNTSEQPIQVQNANIIFSRPDLSVTY